MKSLYLKWLGVAMLGFFAFLQYELWFVDGGISSFWGMQAQVQQLQQHNQYLAERNNKIVANISALKQGSHAVESRARSELGMIRPGEQFYQVIDN